MKQLFEALRRQARNQPAAAAIRQGQQVLTYAQLLEDIEQVAQQLRDRQLGAVGIYLDNGFEWIVIDLACHLAAITVVPLPWFFSPAQLEHACRDAGIDALVAIETQASGITGTGAAISLYRGASLHPLTMPAHQDLSARYKGGKVSYTSGTTGNPKGIYLADAFIGRACESIRDAIPAQRLSTHMSVLPYATLLENIAGVYVPLALGKTLYAESSEDVGLTASLSLDPQTLAGTFNRIQPSSLILTPQLLEVFCTLSELQMINPASLQFVAVGGAHVTDTLIERARGCGIPAYEGYGLTEFASVALLNTPDHDRVGSAGKPLPGVSVSIADDGEILLQTRFEQDGERVGYRVNTGDLGYIDDDGFLFIQGRKGNLIVLSTGRNVSPEWVEAELNTSPLIRQSFVFGEGRPALSALIVASADIDPQKLQQEIERINQRLPSYARVNQWKLAQKPFSVVEQTLTPNGRLKRKNIQSRLPTFITTQAVAEVDAVN